MTYRSLLMAVLALGLGLSGCSRDISPRGVFRAAPAFELPVLGAVTTPASPAKNNDDAFQRLEQLRGNVVVLHFWASWCPPCLEEISNWVAMASRYQGLPLKMVAVTVDEKREAALKVLPAAKIPPNVLSLWDRSGKVPNEYGTRMFPETYLLNKNLEIINKWVGPQDWQSSRVRFAIEKALVEAKIKSR